MTIKIPRGRKCLLMVCGMPFTIPIKDHDKDYRETVQVSKKSGKRKTKKEWE